MLLDIFYFAFKRIRERLFESIMVILGLGFGIAIVSIITSLLIDYNRKIKDELFMPDYRTISINSLFDEYNRSKEPVKKVNINEDEIQMFTMKDLEEIKAMCPTVDYTMIQYRSDLIPTGTTRTEGKSNWWEESIFGWGISEDYIPFHNFKLKEGSLFSPSDYQNNREVIILGGNIAKLIFKNESPIGKVLNFNNIEYSVIGVFEKNNSNYPKAINEALKDNPWHYDNRIYLPTSNLLWSNTPNSFDRAKVGVKESKNLERALEEVRLFMDKKFPYQKIYITNNKGLIKNFSESSLFILFVLSFISITCLVIASINNLNLMLARVLKQKKSMGVSMALGASKKVLFLGVLAEASLLGIVGAILGVILIVIIELLSKKYLITMGINLLFLNLETMGISILLSMILTAISSIIPGIEAAKTDPAVILRQD